MSMMFQCFFDVFSMFFGVRIGDAPGSRLRSRRSLQGLSFEVHLLRVVFFSGLGARRARGKCAVAIYGVRGYFLCVINCFVIAIQIRDLGFVNGLDRMGSTKRAASLQESSLL